MQTFELTATGTVELKDADNHTVSRWVVTFADGGTLGAISILPQGAVALSGVTKGNVGYAVIADPSTNINPGVTPITATGTYIIEASGMDVDLVVGTLAAGTLDIYAIPVRG